MNTDPPPRPSRPDPARRRQCTALEETHPGWRVFHDAGTGNSVWSAYRRAFPTKQEVAAGVRLLIRAATAEQLDEKLKAQTEILAALPPPEPPITPRTFL
ncbi:hypothetical protein [Streptosporangium carneum]|uniref:Uncharacterized protein n=1 Tax=Streptosporangium carneum TaxID=47481 RepID=A0A9W6ME85_9ACTN|nr:hypothetical protein [Streptosporangium carneum]GLK10618.1 hypothetical protein GCM10017600_40240 [Streptosporangium carneum]